MQINKKTNKSIKVEIAIDLDMENLPSFRDLEQELLKKIEKAKEDLLKQILTHGEQALLNRPRYILKDRRTKQFQTILGEMKFRRYRAYDRLDQHVCHPLDDWLGLEEHHKVCGVLKDEIVRLTVDFPFRFAAREIQHWTGVHLTKDATWAISQGTGENCWKKKNQARRWQRHEPLPTQEQITNLEGNEPPTEILCIGMDGTYVKRQEKRKRIGPKHDVKVAVLYTGKEKVDGDMTLTDRQTVIQSRSENLDSFLGRVVSKGIEHYGLNEKTTVLLFGDGDVWIRKFKEFVPQAHYRLDPWHVFEKIKQAFNLKELPQEWVRLTYGNPDGLILEIKSLQRALAQDPTTANEKIDELVAYLKNNREGLLPWKVAKDIQEKHRELFTWGSGHVESQIEIAVYDRHKLNRMSWSKKGLHNLSTLREDKLNQYKKPKFSCSQPPIPTRIDLGSLGILISSPNF